jgi:hypothetical protein
MLRNTASWKQVVKARMAPSNRPGKEGGVANWGGEAVWDEAQRAFESLKREGVSAAIERAEEAGGNDVHFDLALSREIVNAAETVEFESMSAQYNSANLIDMVDTGVFVRESQLEPPTFPVLAKEEAVKHVDIIVAQIGRIVIALSVLQEGLVGVSI